VINAHFIAHEIKNNAQLSGHYLPLIVCIILTSILLIISFTLKRLNPFACGVFSGNFVHNPHEGYRTLVVEQNHPKPHIRGRGLKAAEKGDRKVTL